MTQNDMFAECTLEFDIYPFLENPLVLVSSRCSGGFGLKSLNDDKFACKFEFCRIEFNSFKNQNFDSDRDVTDAGSKERI